MMEKTNYDKALEAKIAQAIDDGDMELARRLQEEPQPINELGCPSNIHDVLAAVWLLRTTFLPDCKHSPTLQRCFSIVEQFIRDNDPLRFDGDIQLLVARYGEVPVKSEPGGVDTETAKKNGSPF